MNRRKFLTSVTAGGTLSLTGCVGAGNPIGSNNEEDLNNHGDLPPPLECDDTEFKRYSPGFGDEAVEWGQDDEGIWEITIDGDTFVRGDTAHIVLTNQSDEKQHTGNENWHSIQVETQAGWEDVRGWADGMALPITDEGVPHEPGDGFEWRLVLTEDDLVAGHMHEGDLVVCPGLPTGRYRFVYSAGIPPLGVEFTLES